MSRFMYHVKQGIRRLLTRLDVGIYRIHYAEFDAIRHNTPNSMDEYYENHSVFSPEMRADRTRFQNEILALLQPAGVALAGRSVADVGCGTGDLLALIAASEPTARLQGYETSAGALREAAATCPQARFAEHDITAAPAEPHDVVFCLEVLEHLMDPDRALRNLLKTLRPGGCLVLSVPDARFDNFGGHINFWGPVSWRRFLDAQADGHRVQAGQLSGEFRANYALIAAPASAAAPGPAVS